MGPNETSSRANRLRVAWRESKIMCPFWPGKPMFCRNKGFSPWTDVGCRREPTNLKTFEGPPRQNGLLPRYFVTNGHLGLSVLLFPPPPPTMSWQGMEGATKCSMGFRPPTSKQSGNPRVCSKGKGMDAILQTHALSPTLLPCDHRVHGNCSGHRRVQATPIQSALTASRLQPVAAAIRSCALRHFGFPLATTPTG
jgi:hypothetical protein